MAMVWALEPDDTFGSFQLLLAMTDGPFKRVREATTWTRTGDFQERCNSSVKTTITR
jgi:hypothetical protein